MSIGIVAKSRLSAMQYAISKGFIRWTYCKTGLEPVSEVVLTNCWLQNPDAGKIQRNLFSNDNTRLIRLANAPQTLAQSGGDIRGANLACSARPHTP